jgi:SAM-dependent methyltransferase
MEIIKTFAPYTVIDDDSDPDDILDRIHAELHAGSGPDTTKGDRHDKEISFELSDFAWMATELSRIPQLQSVSLIDYARGRVKPGKIPLVIRHDLDGDLDTAVLMAELEAERGLRGTYYILPASSYYSDYYLTTTGGTRRYAADIVRRYRRMVPHYLRLQSLGHEIGLHYFPYGTYREKLMDGTQSIVEEVRWLRSNGIDVRGGVGHGSHAADGADMAEIFREYFNPNVNFDALPDRLHSSGPVTFDGVEVPRRALSLKDVTFDYVAEFTKQSPGHWAIRENGTIRYQPSMDEPARRSDQVAPRGMIDQIERRIAGGDLYVVTITLHPVHLRARAAATRALEAAARDAGSAPDVDIAGSRAAARKPGSLHVCRYEAANGTAMETVSVVNRLGFLDYEPYPEDERHRRQIALIGGSILDAPHLQISQKIQGWLRKLYLSEDWIKVSTRAYAARNADRTFLLGAIDRQLVERVPDAWVIVLDSDNSIGAGDLQLVAERLRATGRPVVCLSSDGDGSARIDGGAALTVIAASSFAVGRSGPESLRYDSQSHLDLARRVKDTLAETDGFRGTSHLPPGEKRRTRLTEEMKLTRDDAEALDSLQLDGLPVPLRAIPSAELSALCRRAFARFRFLFEAIDAREHEGLRREIADALQPTVYSASFHSVLGQAACIPNFAGSAGLDLGCSFGLKTVLLKHFGAGRIFGCDVAPERIGGANLWLEQSPIGDMRFFVNPSDSLPFEDRQFNWITAMDLYATLSPEAAPGLFRNCARVLKPGGWLLLHESGRLVPEEPSRVPSWPSGSSSMRAIDPFVIRAELTEAGFTTRFRRPDLGTDIEDHELEAYFKSAPGVFLSAQKTA